VANCHNGTRRAAENFLGHGTDEQFAQAGAAMGAENEQINLPASMSAVSAGAILPIGMSTSWGISRNWLSSCLKLVRAHLSSSSASVGQVSGDSSTSSALVGMTWAA